MNIEEIGPKEAINAIESGSLLIDVREDYELAEAAYGIEFIHIPMGEIQSKIQDLPRNKNLIIGCRSGARSMNVCQFLKMNGFENVKNLQGGIMAWMDNGCPTQ